jgi:plastocyanin
MKYIGIIVGIIIIAVAGGIAFFMVTTQEADVSPAEDDAFVQQEQRDQADPTPLTVIVDDEEEEPAAPAGDAVTITMDDAGYSPQTVTVPAGTTVTFVNNGQTPRWPASDNHPVHEILPDFDAGRGLMTGETYSYTFTEPGRWPFHDHLQPTLAGAVVVE